jgi:antitoxin component of MazEF toxin-antitoxin module
MYIRREATLRSLGGSVFLTIPADIVRFYGLSPGDAVTVEGNGSCVTLKFFRTTTTKAPIVVGEEQVEAVG